MKKTAFSYLELMIAMTLVVIVAILTAPLMTSMGKKPVQMFGEYKCYARYVNGGWKLYESERINTGAYPAEDNLVTRKDEKGRVYCKFTKPVGNISSYSVDIIGGGGSGSMLYYSYASGNKIYYAPAGAGRPGETKHIQDSLVNAFESDGSMRIFICDQNTVSNPVKNCIGTGGDVNSSPRSSMAPKERIEKIKEKLADVNNNCALSPSDIDYLENSSLDSVCRNYLNTYKSNMKCGSAATNLKNSAIPLRTDSTKYTGNSGKSSKIILSNDKYAVAAGGEFGITDKTNIMTSSDMSGFTYIEDDFYHYPANPTPDVSGTTYENTDGEDANNPSEIDEYNEEYFGAGGGAGGFVCKIPSANKSNLMLNCRYTDKTIKDNYCYQGKGGMGAGGAIIIGW